MGFQELTKCTKTTKPQASQARLSPRLCKHKQLLGMERILFGQAASELDKDTKDAVWGSHCPCWGGL